MPTFDYGTLAASAVLVLLGVLIGFQVRGRRKRHEAHKPTYTQMESASPTVPASPLPTKRIRTSSPNALTAREQQVAELAAQGQSNKQIAGAMNLSVSTIQNHLQAVYRKLGVRSRSELSWRLQHLADSDG